MSDIQLPWKVGKGALSGKSCSAAVREEKNPKFESLNPKQYLNPTI
jgi:hypothetical protein